MRCGRSPRRLALTGVLSRSSFRSLVVAVVISWMIVLTVGSLSPMSRYRLGLASANPSAVATVLARRRHRIAHWLCFGGLAFLLALLGRNTRQRVLAATAVAALGLLIEYFQHTIYSNPIETWDVRDDTCASLAGLIVASFVVAAKTALSKDA